MNDDRYFETERLICRRWNAEDIDKFAALCSDRKVMEYFPSTLTFAQCEEVLQKILQKQHKTGFCFPPCQEKSSGNFIGFCGLNQFDFETPFAHHTEIGWRLATPFWGKGYASEAASAWLEFGFNHLPDDHIVSFAVTANHRSFAVMHRIGLKPRPDWDFDHPAIAADSPLSRHHTWAIDRHRWQASRPGAI